MDIDLIHVEGKEFYIGFSSLTISNGFVEFFGSRVILNESTIQGNVFIDRFALRGGSFEIAGGMILNYTGDVLCGMIGSGASISGNIQIGIIESYDAELTILNTTFSLINPSYGFETLIRLESSVLIMNDTCFDPRSRISVSVDAHNVTVNIEDTNITTLSLSLANGTIQSLSLRNMMVSNSELEIDGLQASELEIINMSSIQIKNSSIEFIGIGAGDFFSRTSNNVSVEDSEVDVISSISAGVLNITNSNATRITSILQDVWIVNSTVLFVAKTILINGSGLIEVVGNSVPPGKYIDLIHIENSTIQLTMDAITLMDANANLSIRDSRLIWLCVNNKNSHILVDNSTVNLTMVNAYSLTIDSSTINSAHMGDAPQVFELYNLNITNTTIIANKSIFMSPIGPPTGNIMGTIAIYNTKIYGESLFIGDSHAEIVRCNIYTNNISVAYSDLYFQDSSTSPIFMMDAEATFMGITAPLIAAGDSHITLINGTIDNILAILIIEEFPPESSQHIDVYGRETNISVRDSQINNMYTDYKIVRDWITECDPTTDKGLESRTMYSNTSLPANRAVIFEVVEHGGVIIRNYTKENSIYVLLADVAPDTNPPIIDPLNDTYIEYELGQDIMLQYGLYDETPTTYVVLVNGSRVLNDTYSNGYILTLRLPQLIFDDGTYNITIVAYDSDGNHNTLSTIVVVHPRESPLIIQKPQNHYDLLVGDELVLEWIARDKSPNMYHIYVNGKEVEQGVWMSKEKITYVFRADREGRFNITIIFTDDLGLSSTHTVIIDVHGVTTTETTPTTIKEEKKILGMPAEVAVSLAIAGLGAVLFVLAIIVLRKKG